LATDTLEKDPKVARNEQIVRAFIQAWHEKDTDAAVALLSPDIEYINQPLDPVVGHDAVRNLIQSILDKTVWVKWELRNVFGRGNTVCTERLDRWDFDGKGVGLELPCVGMFDVNDEGKITGWRDYFDNQLWFSKGGPAL
jgi:limonene-1,2-epoxide hydrolase